MFIINCLFPQNTTTGDSKSYWYYRYILIQNITNAIKKNKHSKWKKRFQRQSLIRDSNTTIHHLDKR